MNTRFKTLYTYDREISFAFATHNHEDSLTQQSDKDECDINIIMKKYGVTGQMPQLVGKDAKYGDFTEIGDYRSAMDRINDANEVFMALPAEVRKEFQNDAANFVDFAQDPKNIEQMRKWGLAKPAPEPIIEVPENAREEYDDNGRTIRGTRRHNETPQDTDTSVRGREDDLRVRGQAQPNGPKGPERR